MATLRLGDIAPDFRAESTQGTIDFHAWLGQGWGVLFSHPADFTPVCTTELGATARLADEFARRQVKVAALSVDPLDAHHLWVADINSTQGVSVGFPLIADPDRQVAQLYDMIHPNASERTTVRSLFIIGPDKRIKLIITYPASTGRNFQEVLRVIDSLQLTAAHQVATPADWQQGGEVIVLPGVSDVEAETRHPDGVRRVRPYLRYVKQPG
jgi:alkyl hydroperoxide reductase subunit AhpC